MRHWHRSKLRLVKNTDTKTKVEQLLVELKRCREQFQAKPTQRFSQQSRPAGLLRLNQFGERGEPTPWAIWLFVGIAFDLLRASWMVLTPRSA